MVAAWDSRFGAILHYPADTFAASARLARGSQYEALFRESICVLCLMFSPTQRPTTACRSGHVVAGPRGIRMCATFTLILYCDAIQTPRGQECNIALHSRAFTAPAMPHGQGRGLANAHRGFLCACSPSCAVSALRQNCSEANHRRAPESAG